MYIVFFLLFPLFIWAQDWELKVYVAPSQLHYETGELFFESLLQQGANPRIGHAWVSLSSKDEKGSVGLIEGGHSGEFGIIAPQYLERLMQAANTPEVANPIQVLFDPLEDGIFEKGSGGYIPTYAVSFSLTEEGYEQIRSLLEEGSQEYPFHRWSMTNYNCVRFVLTCLGRIGIVLDAKTTMDIAEPTILQGQKVHMWSDRRFSSLIVETPEKLESELKRMVSLGIAHEI